MDDIAEGFRIGERRFAWGTQPAEVAEALKIRWIDEPRHGWRHLDTACGRSWNLETIGVSMTAQGPGRPVTALCYELAAPEAVQGADPLPDPSPSAWMEPLMRALGTPRAAETTDVSAYRDPSGTVRFNADWPKGDQSVGLSLYGAPRMTAHGPAAGCIWLNWAVVPAAGPFLNEWCNRAEALAREAGIHSGIVTFGLSTEPNPARNEARDGPSLARDSAYALGSPQLLPTPQPIARLLGPRGIGFWRSGDHRRWFASHRWDTIAFGMGVTVPVVWHDVKPAKGGGYAQIAVDGWSVWDLYGSRAIADAVAALRTIPGVTVHHTDGYDC